MATYAPAKRNTAFVFYVGLVSQADGKVLQVNPTLAAGDVKIAKDDGAPANLATLPVVDGDFTKRVKVSLSATEMDADQVTILFVDAAGAEWCDLMVNIQTVARQYDDLAYPATSGRAIDVDASGGVEVTPNQAVNVAQWAGAAVATPTVAGVPEVDVTHAAGAAQASIATQASVTTIDDLLDTEIAALQADLDNIQTRLPAALVGGRMDASIGAVAAGAITNAGFAVDAIDALAIAEDAAQELADQLLDRTAAIEGFTLRQVLRGFCAALLGKADGFPLGPVHMRDLADAKDRITATIDTFGNRTVIVLDLT